MNDYKVIATGIYGEHTVTAIDEKDARREFRARHKGENVGDIHTVTLIRENVPATKAQEREDLEKIKAIVATLGPRSYIGTALDGCLEDAEVNIENDFGDSMKARWQSAEQEIKELKSKLKQAQQGIEELIQKDDERKAALEKMYAKTISADDLTHCKQIAANLVEQLRREVKAKEATILDYADRPETTTFCNAVSDRKSLTKDIGYYTALVERLAKAMPD